MATAESRPIGLASGASPEEVRARAEELRASIAPDLYTPNLYVPWTEIDKTVERLRPAAAELQSLIDADDWRQDSLAAALRKPGVMSVVKHLLVTPSAVGFADGSELPVDTPRTELAAKRVARLLLDIGLPRLLPASTTVVDMLRLGAVALDSRRRGFRRRDSVEADVRDLLRSAIADANNEYGLNLASAGRSAVPPNAGGMIDQVVLLDGKPVAGVASFFAAQTGGRQQRQLMTAYPDLQRELDKIPMSLVVIVDGRGVQEAPIYVLEHLLRSVGACMSRAEARQGALAQALADAAEWQGSRPGRLVALDLVIRSVLESEPEVDASLLPAVTRDSVVALIEFKGAQPHLDLDFDAARNALVWNRRELVAQAQHVRQHFEPASVVQVLADALRLESASTLVTERGLAALVGEMVSDPVLPERMVLAASSRPLDREVVRDIARLNRQHAAGGSVAALVVPELGSMGTSGLTALQRQLATSVIVLDSSALFAVATHVRPRDAFIGSVLRQADLTKANPFNSTGATPPEMFFGREEEEATLLSTLDSNSAALIGGRRIGKTSLLRHAVTAMNDAGWSAYYADCQAVGDWSDFVSHIRPRWEVNLPINFEAAHLYAMAEQLRRGREAKLVIVLDEVDNLLRWDSAEDEGRLGEAFFRACRALSQEGIAQFVFSGERRIATKLWDPGSPHWNFCMPIRIRQLSRRASDLLLETPVRSLGVELSPRSDILNLAWTRTDGHPQIIQELGSRVVHELNQLPPDRRSRIDAGLVDAVTSTGAYARHFVETYWGQASPFERLLTGLIALNEGLTFEDIRFSLTRLGVPHDASQVSKALQMLSLYGIVGDDELSPNFRALFFPRALEALGGARAVVDDHVKGCLSAVGTPDS